MREQFEMGPTPQFNISCRGKLVVKGSDSETAQVRGDDFTAEQSDKGLQISSGSDLYVTAPKHSQLTIKNCNSDLIVKSVQGHVLIDTADGDVVLSRTGDVDITTVQADVAAKRINGHLQIGTVTGDASIRSASSININTVRGEISARLVRGGVILDTVHGDCALANVEGDVEVNHIRGDAVFKRVEGRIQAPSIDGSSRIQAPLGSGKHNIAGTGSITLQWPADSPVKILATANAGITNRLPMHVLEEDDKNFVAKIGADDDPETVLVLDSKGQITLKESDIVNKAWVHAEIGDDNFAFDYDFSALEGIGEQIRNAFSKQMTVFEKQFGSDFAAKIETKLEKAAARAEAAAERARKQAERSVDRNVRRHQRHQSRRNTSSASTRKATAASSDTSEEQLHVLRMLENGKITAAEAQTLLDALK